MESKSKIIKKETDELLEGVELMDERFQLLSADTLEVLTDEPQFFSNRSFECPSLITNCIKSLDALPSVTPPTSKIKRKQYEEVKEKLEILITDFNTLQLDVNIILNPATEAATKTAKLLTVSQAIPSVLNEFIFTKLECQKIKKAMTF